jgi:SAM-dependent methyltransferase
VGWDGDRYQRRFDQLAESGVDVHGEAGFVAALHPRSVLDAGCGTGRVAIELASRGVTVVGVDRDASMVATARRLRPDLEWHVGDLAAVDLGETFEVVVMAGNVPLFTPPGTQAALVAACRRHLAAGGALVAGFELGRGYSVEEYDRHCRDLGLVPVERWSTWDRAPFDDQASYVVSVHREAGPDPAVGHRRPGGVAP